MDKRTAIVIGLGGVLLYGLTRLVMARFEEAQKVQKADRDVDMNSEDSFPASDPPSWTASQPASVQ